MIRISGASPHAAVLCTLLLTAAGACSRDVHPPREYQLTGQILQVEPETQELLVKHEDIKGFMPAMTMPYKVEEASRLSGKQPGDLITATLVVADTSAFLKNITQTGHAEIQLPETQPEISVFDMVKAGEPVPDAPLVDEDGKPRPISSYRGKRLILTFIYTQCPDAEFCPLMSQNFAALQRQIAATPALSDVQLLSISFDPEHDTPQVLKAYARTQQADPKIWHFATAPIEHVKAFAAKFGLAVTSNGSPVLIHNLATAVIDAQGRLISLHSTNQWKPADFVAQLTKTAPSTH
jgi:protein SCO1/2